MLSDRLKLFLLLGLLLSCLITLFTSPSPTMNEPAMKVLSPSSTALRQRCQAPWAALQQCQEEHKVSPPSVQKEDCASHQTALHKCQDVVQRAYRHINLGGCPMQLKALTLCEAEWCSHVRGGGGGSGLESVLSSCDRECARVRESLTTCVEGYIHAYFRRSGLQDDGIRKEG